MVLRWLLLLLLLLSAASVSCALALATSTRRQLLVGGVVGTVGVQGRVVEAAVISAPLCVQGQGEGCSELAGESGLLKELQQRSSEKREERDKAALERYNFNNFGDYFAAGYPSRKLVRHKNGTFEALTDAEIEAGRKAGAIGTGTFGTGWTNYAGRNPHFFIED